MIYLALASLMLLVVSLAISTSGQVTHAAISAKAAFRNRKFAFAGLYRDTEGNYFDMEQSVVAKAKGSSCEAIGIPNGALVVATKISHHHEHLKNGDVVIINSVKSDGTRPHRFRRIASVTDNTVHFHPAKTPLNPKPLSDVVGVVTHVRV